MILMVFSNLNDAVIPSCLEVIKTLLMFCSDDVLIALVNTTPHRHLCS